MKPTQRRRVPRVAIILIAGAVTAAGVALLAGVVGFRSASLETKQPAAGWTIRRFESLLGTRLISTGHHAVSSETRMGTAELPAWSYLRVPVVDNGLVIMEDGVGWPIRCFRCRFSTALHDSWGTGHYSIQSRRGELYLISSPKLQTSLTYGGVSLPPIKTGGPEPPLYAIRCISIAPIWSGFAASTILYSTVWGLLCLIPRWVRLAVEHRRLLSARCICCGYDLHSMNHDICPECGTELESRAGDE